MLNKHSKDNHQKVSLLEQFWSGDVMSLAAVLWYQDINTGSTHSTFQKNRQQCGDISGSKVNWIGLSDKQMRLVSWFKQFLWLRKTLQWRQLHASMHVSMNEWRREMKGELRIKFLFKELDMTNMTFYHRIERSLDLDIWRYLYKCWAHFRVTFDIENTRWWLLVHWPHKDRELFW